MIVLSCTGISLSFGTNIILEDIGFSLQDSDKAGIIGVNGAGKTTLMKILAGIIQPDSGNIFVAKGQKLGYLGQNSGLDSSKTLWEELLGVYAEVIAIEARIRELELEISLEKGDVLGALSREYDSLTDKYERLGGYEYNSRIKGVLKGLGFGESQFSLPVSALSGGQKTRLALAKLLLEEPDVLLLDEPTNHLDISAIEWLEDFLKNYRRSVLVISHDRYFLDMVTNKTIEIENHQCKVYKGNYSRYIEQKAADREAQQKQYDLQQKEIARLEAFIEQQRRWNREKNIIAAESRQKAIDRMEKIDKPKALPDKIRIKFRSGIVSGNDVLFVENLSKEYPGKPLFKDINFQLKRNEKVFLLGPNGCGKSTLLKILSGKLEKTSGVFEYGHNVNIGYYDQEQEGLDESKTIIEEVWDSNEQLTQTEMRNALASFLFKGEDVFKSISVLSGGEKSRVALLKLILSESNFLLLDEPTNHLDINSREVLEQSLQGYEGTLLVVSHDRYFINKLATRILEIDNLGMNNYPGNYSYYLSHRPVKAPDNAGNTGTLSQSKSEYMAVKEEKARLRKLEKQLEKTLEEINAAENRTAEIDEALTRDEVASDHVALMDLMEEQNALKLRLEELYSLWESLESEKERAQK